MAKIAIINRNFPVRTCASCEFTYWGGWKADKSCPKCGFSHYGAFFVYEWHFILEWILKTSYRRKVKYK